MAKVAPYNTDSPEYPPQHRSVYHDHDRPACSALDGPDLHWQAHIGFSYRTSGSSAIAGFCPHRSHRAALPQWALQDGPEAD